MITFNTARAEAIQMIASGESPEDLAHAINDDPHWGLSSPITAAEYSRGGYISSYLTLAEWASQNEYL